MEQRVNKNCSVGSGTNTVLHFDSYHKFMVDEVAAEQTERLDEPTAVLKTDEIKITDSISIHVSNCYE